MIEPVHDSRTEQAAEFEKMAQGSSSGDSQHNNSDSERQGVPVAQLQRQNYNAKLANPLAGYDYRQLEDMGAEFARRYNMGDESDIDAFRQGAAIAKDPFRWDEYQGLSEADREILEKEFKSKWQQPRLMYLVVVICSVCAAVQGMDETVVNGAQIFYSRQFGIADPTNKRSTWLLGLTNSAPYLCCAILGCWLTVPFNHWFGRRGTIFITCLISSVTCFWQAFTNTWWHMFIARFCLGLGIGPKSATVPIYAAESTPPAIRGALVMQWQMWTAFGIMLGYVADLALYKVPSHGSVHGLNWRLMMGSAMLPAVFVCCVIFMLPESPRWYMSKGKYAKAYKAMSRLRYTKVQAARDIFYIHTLLEAESHVKLGHSKLVELVKVPRNRRAMLGSEIVMFMQQFCGVNVIAYYSSAIFLEAGFTEIAALSASLGFGIINFLFALPAVYTIDTFGRRNLLLTTFPFMSLFLFFTGFSFWIPGKTARVGCIALGIYLFGIVYSPGEGPVPFTYSAEAYPLYVRSYGMSLATATTWFFNFVLSITWPSLLAAFKPQGAFSWYAVWNIIGFFLVLLFLPETKGKTLEELDQVFNVPTRVHAAYGLRQIPYFFNRYILRRNVKPEQLYEREDQDQGAVEKNGPSPLELKSEEKRS